MNSERAEPCVAHRVESERATASRRVPTALVLLLALCAAVSVANVYYAQPLLDAIAADFDITHAAVGGVITATQVGCALALLLVVPLGDLINRKRLICMQLLLLIIVLAAVGFASSPALLLMGMVGVGMLGTAMTQGLIAYAAAVAHESERGRVVGAAQSGVVVGLLMARSLAGVITDLAGWRSPAAASVPLRTSARMAARSSALIRYCVLAIISCICAYLHCTYATLHSSLINWNWRCNEFE